MASRSTLFAALAATAAASSVLGFSLRAWLAGCDDQQSQLSQSGLSQSGHPQSQSLSHLPSQQSHLPSQPLLPSQSKQHHQLSTLQTDSKTALANDAYHAVYDNRLRHPLYTFQHLSGLPSSSLPCKPSMPSSSTMPAITPPSPPGNRKLSTFAPDPRIPAIFQSTNSHYFRSGYDRGHMVPAADCKASQASMDESFLLSNVAPQVGPGFNRHYWAGLEGFVRDLRKSYEHVWVVTLPLYLPQRTPQGGWEMRYPVLGKDTPDVSVPTHFSKVVMSKGFNGQDGPVSLAAFVLPNAAIPDSTPLTSFQVPLESVERSSGLIMLPTSLRGNFTNLCSQVECKIPINEFYQSAKAIAAPVAAQPARNGITSA